MVKGGKPGHCGHFDYGSYSLGCLFTRVKCRQFGLSQVKYPLMEALTLSWTVMEDLMSISQRHVEGNVFREFAWCRPPLIPGCFSCH